MTMAHNGLSKLIEECGEVIQIAAKIQALPPGFYNHWDGQDLALELAKELADVMAAGRLVMELHHLDELMIGNRAERKYQQFLLWHADPDN